VRGTPKVLQIYIAAITPISRSDVQLDMNINEERDGKVKSMQAGIGNIRTKTAASKAEEILLDIHHAAVVKVSCR
jgi:hypothetical protein